MSDSPHNRHLALCGVIFEDAAYCRFQEAWEAMKRRFFKGDPDEPIIAHRKEIMSRSGPFSPLGSPAILGKFNAAFLSLVGATPFVGLVVVIDKPAHLGRYSNPLNPYHYCLVALLQRYCFWLGQRTGDVMGESRGTMEDERLKAAYLALYEGGDWHNRADFYQARLTSKEIKLKPKPKNIAGLQLADLLAHPAKQRCLLRNGISTQEGEFGQQVADALWKKLYHCSDGKTEGWGEVYIP
jgi:hypothetical protein